MDHEKKPGAAVTVGPVAPESATVRRSADGGIEAFFDSLPEPPKKRGLTIDEMNYVIAAGRAGKA